MEVREDRAKRDEEAHKEEIAKLLAVADEKMKREIMAAESERKAQQKMEEEKHKQELERLKEEMEKKRQDEVERLERERLEEREKHEQELDNPDSECNWCIILRKCLSFRSLKTTN
jgi:colicin import membrane protein